MENENKEEQPSEVQGKEEETEDILKKTEALVARQEEANKKHEELLNREAELQARRMLGGKSTIEEKPEQKEPTDKEHMQELEKKYGMKRPKIPEASIKV